MKLNFISHIQLYRRQSSSSFLRTCFTHFFFLPLSPQRTQLTSIHTSHDTDINQSRWLDLWPEHKLHCYRAIDCLIKWCRWNFPWQIIVWKKKAENNKARRQKLHNWIKRYRPYSTSFDHKGWPLYKDLILWLELLIVSWFLFFILCLSL